MFSFSSVSAVVFIYTTIAVLLLCGRIMDLCVWMCDIFQAAAYI